MENKKRYKPQTMLPEQLNTVFEKLCDTNIKRIGRKTAIVQLNTLKAYLDNLKDGFKKKKAYSNDHIVSVLYNLESKQSPKIVNYCKLQAIFYVVDFTLNSISHFKFRYIPNTYQKYLIDLIWGILIDMELIEKESKGKSTHYGLGTRNFATSSEIYESAEDHLLNVSSICAFSEFVNPHVSAFLLRQAIELRIKNALGISFVYKGQSLLKLTPDRLFDFIFGNSKIQIPITAATVKVIHSWTNYFIHAGYLCNSWMNVFANEMLRPLFQAGRQDRTWSMFGAIIIDKNYYETELENALKEYLAKMYKCEFNELSLFRMQHAECLIGRIA